MLLPRNSPYEGYKAGQPLDYPPEGPPAATLSDVSSASSLSNAPLATSSPSPNTQSSDSSGLPQADINVIIAVACLLFITICIGVGGWVYYVRRRKAATRAEPGSKTSRNTIETRATSPTSSIVGLISPDESVLHEPTAFYASRMVRARDSQVGPPPVEEV